MIQAFSIDKIVKSGARFDFEKGKWFNQQYMHRISDEACVHRILHDYKMQGQSISIDEANTICKLYKDRIHFLKIFMNNPIHFSKNNLCMIHNLYKAN